MIAGFVIFRLFALGLFCLAQWRSYRGRDANAAFYMGWAVLVLLISDGFKP